MSGILDNQAALLARIVETGQQSGVIEGGSRQIINDDDLVRQTIVRAFMNQVVALLYACSHIGGRQGYHAYGWSGNGRVVICIGTTPQSLLPNRRRDDLLVHYRILLGHRSGREMLLDMSTDCRAIKLIDSPHMLHHLIDSLYQKAAFSMGYNF